MRAIHGKTDDPALEGISNPPVATMLHVLVLTRRHFFIAAAAFLAFVIYGSLIPFHYRPLPWNEALAQFAKDLAFPTFGRSSTTFRWGRWARE